MSTSSHNTELSSRPFPGQRLWATLYMDERGHVYRESNFNASFFGSEVEESFLCTARTYQIGSSRSAQDQIALRPVQPKHESLTISNKTQVTNFYYRALDLLERVNCSSLAQSLIDVIEPLRSTSYPYCGEKTPDWWPKDMVYLHPRSLKSSGRAQLLLHILRNIRLPTVTTSTLHEAAKKATIKPPWKSDIVNQIFHVRKTEELYENEKIDQAIEIPWTAICPQSTERATQDVSLHQKRTKRKQDIQFPTSDRTQSKFIKVENLVSNHGIWPCGNSVSLDRPDSARLPPSDPSIRSYYQCDIMMPLTSEDSGFTNEFISPYLDYTLIQNATS